MTVWVWEDRNYCDLAIAKVSHVEPVRTWLSHVDQQLSMEFGVLIETEASVGS